MIPVDNAYEKTLIFLYNNKHQVLYLTPLCRLTGLLYNRMSSQILPYLNKYGLVEKKRAGRITIIKITPKGEYVVRRMLAIEKVLVI